MSEAKYKELFYVGQEIMKGQLWVGRVYRLRISMYKMPPEYGEVK